MAVSRDGSKEERTEDKHSNNTEAFFSAFEMLFQNSPDLINSEDDFQHECSEIQRLPRWVTRIIPRLQSGIGGIIPRDFFQQKYLIGR